MIKWVPIDQSAVDDRIARITARSIKGALKTDLLKLAVSMTDLTTLEGKDTAGKVMQLCRKALQPSSLVSVPPVAAVCVYPSHVKTAVQALTHSSVKVASVATGFPSGNTSLKIKCDETKRAVGDGAQEVDMVISRGKFLAGEYAYVTDEIAAIKNACGRARLKVILETGELGTLEHVRLASDLAIAAGADFIKTSTGKIQPAATLPVTFVMLEAIAEHYDKTGRQVGMKPAGGISTSKQALHYLTLVYEVLGQRWLTNEWFRFGASSLVNDLVLQMHKQQLGTYYNRDKISID
jgi:deoxyribose-phosphate aldolase